MDAIRTDRLTRSFDGVTAVDRLTLSVSEGEIFGLVGPDGAGKTTTMRLLTAIMEPTSGDAWVAGHHIVQQPEAVKEAIGYMSQRFGLYPDLTVMENIDFYADVYDVPRRGRKEKIDRLLAFSNLTPFKKRLAGNLSGGMKQKLGLACALVHTPKVLFLDEPTNGVDPVSRRDFWIILYRLVKEGMTVFVTTAYLDEAERCDRVGLMHRSRLIRVDAPGALKQSLSEVCFEVRSGDQRAAREILSRQPGVTSVEPAGATLHLFLAPQLNSAENLQAAAGQGARFTEIPPSLEDVFIALIRKEEAAWAA